MKHKIKITIVETYEKEFLIEAGDEEEARANAEKAVEHDYPCGYYQDLITEDIKDYSITYAAEGMASEEDMRKLIELEYEG